MATKMATLSNTEQVVGKCRDLFQWPIFGVAQEVISKREFETILRQEGFLVFCIDEQQGEAINSKERLMNAMADACHFPDYFGKNWDALKDCLCGLYELPDKPKGIVLYFDSPPSLGWTDLSHYFRIIEVVRWIHIKQDVAFRLLLPEISE
jgi:hypothetical protein